VTLVEVIIAMPILLVAMTLFSATVVSMMRQRTVNSESAVAAQQVQTLFERLRNERLEDAYALYNADDFDDPLGPGTAPGNSFQVDGLLPALDAQNGVVGEIFFPVVNTALVGEPPTFELREDGVDEALGMPRDLNRDHVIDDLDHAGDYILLPVIARVRWQGEFGLRELEMFTLLTAYRDPTE
jgi:type II secretory pathway pseudopilin PulG